MLEGDQRVYVGTAGLSPKIPLVKAGDTVILTVNDSRDSMLTINEFKGDSY